jgi:Flp pilus assembly protein TadG
MRRRRRTSQTGQVVVVTALMATVIFGAMALTVDLSLHTFNQRTLQNVADAAALAGATDLGITPTGAQEQQGITDALSTIKQNQGFPTTWTGATTATTCTNSASVSGYCETVTYQNYTVKISAPPQTANGSSNRSANNFEVDMYVNVTNNFGAFVGTSNSTVGARAVAYHSGPPSPYDYTFFSATEVDSGNQVETIAGNAYVGNGYAPQSASKAGLCVGEITEPALAADTDSDAVPGAQDSDVDDQGHVVFAAVPPTVKAKGTGDPTYGQSPASCPASGQLYAQTTQPASATPPPLNCPLGANLGSDSGGNQCVMASPSVPSVALPTATSAVACGGTVDNSTTAGIYSVAAGCTVNLSFTKGDINCVDLVLGVGASVNVIDKKGQDYMTSWDYNFLDTVATVAIGKLTIPPTLPPPAPPSCPGAANGTSPDLTPTQADTCVICAQPSTATCTASSCPIALGNGSTGCCSDSLFIGTIFLPGQQISFATNQAMEDVGQIYCGFWNVQSGNHPNPIVQHDNGATAFVAETLRLVE